MISRSDQLTGLLTSQQCFKMICGAGNEQPEKVMNLACIYTLAGAKILDVCANIEIVKATKQGIMNAIDVAKTLGINIGITPFIMVSVGMQGDHHVRKATIDAYKCVACGLCEKICPTNAIKLDKHYYIEQSACIGCGKCGSICPKTDAIHYQHIDKQIENLLPTCLQSGAELLELHASVSDVNMSLYEWGVDK